MTSTPILEIRNLCKVFDRDLFQKKQIILDNLSLSFPEGKCTALMGHNGAGKTTTIRTIFGLIRPDKGEVLFRGQPIKQEDKRSIGYMPETNKLPLNLTCEEILWHQLRVFNPPSISSKNYGKVIEESLREIQLWDHRKKKVGSLSKGMGRRLSWAQATIHKPSLIILDEPMSGLDPLGHKLMIQLIQKLRSENTSIVLCTHELWSIELLCDEAHIIQKGKLRFSTLSTGSSANAKKSLHRVTLSGIDPKELESHLNRENLPRWLESMSLGHKVDLTFEHYAEAVRWLTFALDKGFLIMNFEKSSYLDENHLITYFSEEKVI